MSDEVCGYCGRANGWHMVGCPTLMRFVGPGFVDPTVLVPEVKIEETDEDIVLIARLPEVE